MGKQSRNQRRRVPQQSIGLLFARKDIYMERLWDRAYQNALIAGKTKEQASKIADQMTKEVKAKA